MKKLTQVTKHKEEIEKRRTKQIQVKEKKEVIVRSKKRSLKEDGIGQSQKRLRTNTSYT